jgi:hypothetical protein
MYSVETGKLAFFEILTVSIARVSIAAQDRAVKENPRRMFLTILSLNWTVGIVPPSATGKANS